MKKIISMCAALCLSVGCLAGCGSVSGEPNSADNTTTTSPTQTTTSQATTTAPPETTTTTTTTVTTSKKEVSLSQIIDEEKSAFFYVGKNSANGLQILAFVKYNGTKEIKYYTVDFEMYNSVMDPAYDDISHSSKFSEKVSGPAQSGDYLMIFEKDRPSKYCGNCYYLYIKRIELEYMDGTKEVADLEWKSENMMISLGTTKCDEVWTPLINQLKDYYPDFFSRNNV